MTELEKIAYAKTFIDKLANGINPLNDQPIPDGDIVNNVRLSRCFFYVSDILRQVCENGGVTKPKRVRRIAFALPIECLDKFEYSREPISISSVVGRINALIVDERMKPLSYRQVCQWLINIGMVEYIGELDGKRVLRPTEAGLKMGISLETRKSQYNNEYQVVVYNESMQRFIVDNIDSIIHTEYKKQAYKQSEE